MRNFRRLPPLLRVASIFSLLGPLAPLVWLIMSHSSSPQSGVYVDRVGAITVNLIVFGMVCTFAVHAYSTRFRQPDKRPFPLDSWQSQLRAILVPSALPFCALVWAVVIPPTAPAFWAVFPISIMGAVVSLALAIPDNNGRQAIN
jgi:hypothetical protein